MQDWVDAHLITVPLKGKMELINLLPILAYKVAIKAHTIDCNARDSIQPIVQLHWTRRDEACNIVIIYN